MSVTARDGLARLAVEHGTTIRCLVGDLARSTPTRAEYVGRAEPARAELASVPGSAPNPQAEAKARALQGALGRLSGQLTGSCVGGARGRFGPYDRHDAVRLESPVQ